MLLLSACASEPPPVVQVDSDTSPKINLDVLTVVVLDRTDGLTADTPYASNNFQPTLANALRHWATDKLVAVGSTGEAVVVINDASLKSQALPHSDNWIKRDQATKYIGHVAIDMDVSGREGQGKVTAEASHFETLPENASSIERQNAYTKVLNGIMRDINTNMRRAISDHISNFVVTAPAVSE